MPNEMAVINHEGDTKIIWDAENEVEVQVARDSFKKLVKEKKYAAFSVTKKGEKDQRITEFDPEAEKIILVPPIAGG